MDLSEHTKTYDQDQDQEQDRYAYNDGNRSLDDKTYPNLPFGNLDKDDFDILKALYVNVFYKGDEEYGTRKAGIMVPLVFDKIIPAVIMEEKGDDNNTCSICLDRMSTVVETIRLLRCNHVFHRDCIFKWLSTNPSCPYCRASTSTLVRC
ncbi:E3 ubiquitin-protein ligase SDIR1-like [Chenopodium quinoa]|uniref:E3 ubiquitin-protein ligase SDIR1-like n=1 Tax=Chenopodium quinoa TaxID=63459 RepID=UPI000B786A3A|nr:E3 ubiquitin-protein ligase SDIR1-like [Chenopodium quinoa]